MDSARAPAAARHAAAVLAPLLLAAGWLILPGVEGDAAARLAAIAHDAGRWRLAWILLALGALLAIPLGRHYARPVARTSRAGALAGRALVATGAAALVGTAAVRGLVALHLAENARDPALTAGSAEALDDLTRGPVRALVYAPEILAAGLVVLGVALVWRSPPHRMAGVLVAVGALVMGLSLVVEATGVAGAGALVLAAGGAAYAAERPAPPA